MAGKEHTMSHRDERIAHQAVGAMCHYLGLMMCPWQPPVSRNGAVPRIKVSGVMALITDYAS